MSVIRRRGFYIFLLFFLVFLSSTVLLHSERWVHIRGDAMGTTYTIKVALPRAISNRRVSKLIRQRLSELNQTFSTYDGDSELSRLNRDQRATPIQVSSELLRILWMGQHLHQWSDGAWDGTIGPVLRLWGFGAGASPLSSFPSEEQLSKALDTVGYAGLQVDLAGRVQKSPGSLEVDLSSIAKGYAVDQIGVLLTALGAGDYFVEIGGEVLASGANARGDSFWRIGIEDPRQPVRSRDVYAVVPLRNMALASSGDYRQSVTLDGQQYSHVIDPRTGYPVSNRVRSVSVLAQSCVIADGLATAILVMGVASGLELLAALPHVEGFILYEDQTGELQATKTAGFSMKDDQIFVPGVLVDQPDIKAVSIPVIQSADAEGACRAYMQLARDAQTKRDQDYPTALLVFGDARAEPVSLIGGLGPLASLNFLKRWGYLNRRFMVLMLTQTPDRSASLNDVSAFSRVQTMLCAAMTTLAQYQPQAPIYMLCNTAHAFLDKPPYKAFTSIIALFESCLRSHNVSHLTVLATQGTVSSQLFSRMTIPVRYPKPVLQNALMSLIYDDLKAQHHVDDAAAEKMRHILDVLRGSEHDDFLDIGLCCTELPMCIAHEKVQHFLAGRRIRYWDPLQVLGETLARGAAKAIR